MRAPMRNAILGVATLALLGCGLLRSDPNQAAGTLAADSTAPAPQASVPAAGPTPTPGIAELEQALGSDSLRERSAAVSIVAARDDIPSADRAAMLYRALEQEATRAEALPPPPQAYLPADAILKIRPSRLLGELGPDAAGLAEGGIGEAAEWGTLVRARLGQGEALPEVRRLLTEAEAPEVRMEAARVLGEVQDRDAIPDLIAALGDPFVASGQDSLGSYSIYPVRDQASWTLLSLGLEVTPAGDGEYEVVEP